MITAIILTALQIIFIHVLFWNGMLLGKVRLWYLKRESRLNDLHKSSSDILKLHRQNNFLSSTTENRFLNVAIVSCALKILFSFLRKPLFDCLICMTSIWGTIIFFLEFNHTGINFVPFLFTVGGMLTLVYGVIGNAEDSNGEKFVNENPNGIRSFGVESKDGKHTVFYENKL